jgi:hypothetical protein
MNQGWWKTMLTPTRAVSSHCVMQVGPLVAEQWPTLRGYRPVRRRVGDYGAGCLFRPG